jgi:hypothetical protein
VSQQRLVQALRAIQRFEPMHAYRRLYRAKFIGQSADLQRVDVRPYDPSLPDMAGIELRHGIPGAKVQVSSGCTLQVGWDDGKPDKPFAALWSSDASATRIVFPVGTSLELGTDGATEAAMLGTKWKEFETRILQALSSHIHAGVQTGGGVSGPSADLASTITTELASLGDKLSGKVKIG